MTSLFNLYLKAPRLDENRISSGSSFQSRITDPLSLERHMKGGALPSLFAALSSSDLKKELFTAGLTERVFQGKPRFEPLTFSAIFESS